MKETHYKNKDAVLLESEALSAVLIPNPGGKLASLVNKKSGFEYLVQRSDPVYKERPYGELFVEAECAGFDDMFPTIDPCHCEDGPWTGTLLPDHGEVWALPWQVEEIEKSKERKNTAVKFTTYGVKLPYRLEKEVAFAADNRLRWRYRLTNLSPCPFDYLWAGHLMINLTPKTRIVLPVECHRAVTVLSDGSRKFGDVQNWPDFRDRENRPYRADIIRPKEAKAFEKFYFLEKLQNGFCELNYPEGNGLKIAFTTENVPYLGLLVNEDSWDGLYNIIVEPCSVGFDRPDTAKRFGQRSVAPPLASVEWEMTIDVL